MFSSANFGSISLQNLHIKHEIYYFFFRMRGRIAHQNIMGVISFPSLARIWGDTITFLFGYLYLSSQTTNRDIICRTRHVI